ncbi:hypothetical protein L1887_50638 [Cichorium endivia]|nr:hypothetical protein L1887_50638 [Cichorium endivia]
MARAGSHEVLGLMGRRAGNVGKVFGDDSGELVARHAHEGGQDGVRCERQRSESASRVRLGKTGEEGVELADLALGAILARWLVDLPARPCIEVARRGSTRISDQMRLRPRPGFLGEVVVESRSVAACTGSSDPHVAHAGHGAGDDREDVLEVDAAVVVDGRRRAGIGDDVVACMHVAGAVGYENIVRGRPRIAACGVARGEQQLVLQRWPGVCLEGGVVVSLEVHGHWGDEARLSVPACSSAIKVDKQLVGVGVHIVGEASLAAVGADVAALVAPDPRIVGGWDKRGATPSEGAGSSEHGSCQEG